MEKDRLQYLLTRYAGGSATEQEHRELLGYLTDREDTTLVYIADHITAQEPGEGVDDDTMRELIREITLVDKPETRQVVTPVDRIHFLRRSWFKYAAAIIILFGIGAYLWTTNKKASQPLTNGNKQQQTDIPPGGEKAVLTLADGTRILLDSAANGNIAQQGNAQVVKLSNGQIAYNTEGVSTEVLSNTLHTPVGGQYQVTLPDGTKVWLNAASSITYPTAFTGKERSVKITGEVYFEVASLPLVSSSGGGTKGNPQASHSKVPFMVDVDGKAKVEVLGTHFNINSYAHEDAIKTTLLEGKVKVSATQPQTTNHKPQTILSPGQQAQLTPQQITTTNNVDIDQIMAWKNGLFNFNGLGIREVMKQLERWYDIKVMFEGQPPTMTFRGEMFRNVNLSDVLDMLQKMEVKFRLDGKTLIIHE